MFSYSRSERVFSPQTPEHVRDLTTDFDSVILGKLNEAVGEIPIRPLAPYIVKKYGNTQVSVGSTRSGMLVLNTRAKEMK